VDADQSVVDPAFIKVLEQQGKWIALRKLTTPVIVGGFVAGMEIEVSHEAKLKMTFATPSGQLVLTNVKCWISTDALPPGMGDVLLSRPIMLKLGYDPQSMLNKARESADEYDMSDVDVPPSPLIMAMYVGESKPRTVQTPEEVRYEKTRNTFVSPRLSMTWTRKNKRYGICC
jgi:hypothetical protein